MWYVRPDHATLEQPLQTAPEHFDVLIIGAGLSGIGAAHHLNKLYPGKSYVILDPGIPR